MMKIKFKSIGEIYSPYDEKAGIPIQPVSALGIHGCIVLKDKFIKGIKDLDGFSHIILIYYLHKTKKSSLRVKPFLDTNKRGIFSTRSPARPNHIGLSVVRLIGIQDNHLIIENVDILNGTPLLDIKPFIPEIDCYDSDYKIGWFTSKVEKLNEMRSDGRFK